MNGTFGMKRDYNTWHGNEYQLEKTNKQTNKQKQQSWAKAKIVNNLRKFI